MFSPQCQLSTFCHAFLRRAACIGKWLSEAVVKPYVFLRGLLLLAGDVERNPGPIQGRQRVASLQYNAQGTHTVACSGFDKYTSWRLGGIDAWLPEAV